MKPLDPAMSSIEQENHNSEAKGNGHAHDGKSLPLPIDYVKRQVMSKMRKHLNCVFAGETGCGKSTQIPQYCLEAGFADGDRIVAITQPRKVAARALADRVAHELGCQVGERVGYKFRFEDNVGPSTKLAYMTDGILLREALHDCLLSKYSVVIVDEAHERSIHTDVLLYVLKLAQQERAKVDNPLRIVIMSATMNVQKFAHYFDAHVFKIPGRAFSVQLLCGDHVSIKDENYLYNAVSSVLVIHETEPLENGFLVFLTGQDEINAACKIINQMSKKKLNNSITALPLYSSVCPSIQAKCFEPTPNNSRKVIFATNIAETSLTIPNIRIVIDSGKVKQKVYNAERGVDVMKVVNISKAQAHQRAGRAGRVAAGKCFRLYTSEEYDEFADSQEPEILRSNLSSIMLNLAKMGLKRIRNLRLLDNPSSELVSAAVEELRHLGAVVVNEERFRVTSLGNQVVKFPLDPKLVMILVSATRLQCLEEALTIVAFLATDSVFASMEAETAVGVEQTSNVEDLRRVFDSNEGDHVRLLKIYRAYRSRSQNNRHSVREWCSARGILYRKMEEVVRIRKQLLEIANDCSYAMSSCGADYTPLRRAICRGLFLNACIYDRSSGVYKMHRRPGVTVKIHPSSCLARAQVNAFVYTDLIDTNETYACNNCIIDADWLKEAESSAIVSPSLRNANSQRQPQKRSHIC